MLLVALTLQSFYRSIMTLDYQLHLPEYLAKCINIDLPELHCDGQCVLMKKVAEQERDGTKKNLLVYEYSSLYVTPEYVNFSIAEPYADVEKNNISFYSTDYHYNYNLSLFRPPIS